MERQEIETWVPAVAIKQNGSVLDFTNLYEVSDMGRVRSLNYHRSGKIGILTPGVSKKGNGPIWYTVVLRKGNKKYTLKVHSLVLSSFKGSEYFPGAVIDHINPRTSVFCDNRLINLRWTTQKDNTNTDHCKAKLSKAHTNHPAKSKRVKVTDLITSEAIVYPSSHEAARRLNILKSIVSNCILRTNGFYRKRNIHFEYV